ncbi:Ppx/GppA family phosphatase [Nocardioides panacisoli]|uniref:Ppx/GppA phosphatase family protein n=1 Tax=Nocardioides panacisoli TaxID=627624 RepID=UPI001C627005|nr:Ppx/GppA phosphatase family protein [Nocardioides panacisoli]QYJ02463.1 Ppx/GppA family phosphatase [Nocardioides panacisoli]
MNVAAIDCGTNTIKLLVGDLAASPDGNTGIIRESRMVRLGQGVDATGRLAPEALERTLAAVDEYAAIIADAGVERVRFCATSATRDAENAAEFRAGVTQRLGVEPEVLPGAEEARLAFAGAVRGLVGRVQDPVMVVDIGGGSTELIRGTATGGPDQEHSMDIGSVRMTERHLHADPPTAEEVAACVADIDAVLDSSPVDPGEVGSVVGVAGTITQIAALTLGLPAYERERTDKAVLRVDDVEACIDRLLSLTVAERTALPSMHPGRADVIGAGGLILSRVLRRTPATSFTVAETDILDGIAWSLVEG